MTETLPEVTKDYSPALQSNQFIGATFAETMEIAKFFAESDLIPAHFQGKPANVFIALELAARMDMSPFMVMQSLYVVHGRPGLEGKFLIALANRSGWDLQYDIVYDKSGNITSCTAYSNRNGVYVRGPAITSDMVKNEGWNKPKDVKDRQGNVKYQMPSKWSTMPELMYRYRAGSYFVNTVCPQLKMGMATVEELEDTIDIEAIQVTTKPPRKGKESVATEPETQEVAQEDRGKRLTFQAVAAGYAKDKAEVRPEAETIHLISLYVAAYAQHSGAAVATIEANALDKWEAFCENFERWVKMQESSKANQEKQAAEEKKAKEAKKEPAKQKEIPQPVSSDQLEEIVNLAKIKNFPIIALLDKYRVSSMDEMDIKTANMALDYLASL